ncbi:MULTISPECIES: molybdopterin-dependent oxidoreductase [Pandoraea]|jgi:DMSO/TMAO reductase YedYZ molybdopterin-dependent catalytic subunit|uniref:Protein-methionine-sulfoxide reductase catalytic subunit MsrP n=2 Tax=Pandoraea pnomenusa TaxID=93220 RepID=A0A378YN06_9BURK|nr:MULTISPECIES: molybdopterin-dependent oxidoreductase [Pandoraea]SUA78556.1 Sulfoxide reductase catalytic subunit yedY precursor [Pandoraea pnomenusa]VVE71422.1 Protein-methionine-sulfoxide reductase catalytic subunit MsrP [Pandoraea pnomenusa]
MKSHDRSAPPTAPHTAASAASPILPPEYAFSEAPPESALAEVSRRRFLRRAGALSVGATLAGRALDVFAAATAPTMVTLPFANGERELVAYPQKRPLIRLTARPPQLETPFEVFNDGLITPNDAFFVRYHLAGIPTDIDPAKHRIRVGGSVSKPLDISLASLKKDFGQPVEIVAVHQCSGNSRGFFEPRVAGGQIANGAMGNARWRGIPLKRILERAGVSPNAKQVTFEGLDRPIVPATPEFVKALDLDHAMDGEVMIAFAMNGKDLPMLNGFPVRLVVPGYYGTYWVKHLADINVIDKVFDGFWMATAYRIPDNDCNCVEPGKAPEKTKPIGRFTVRSFITSHADGQQVAAGKAMRVRGIAFDGGEGIRDVQFSTDGGQTWHAAKLGQELSKYSFREWTANFTPPQAGEYVLKVRATNRAGVTQPLQSLWNPAGYLRNGVESVRVVAA